MQCAICESSCEVESGLHCQCDKCKKGKKYAWCSEACFEEEEEHEAVIEGRLIDEGDENLVLGAMGLVLPPERKIHVVTSYINMETYVLDLMKEIEPSNTKPVLITYGTFEFVHPETKEVFNLTLLVNDNDTSENKTKKNNFFIKEGISGTVYVIIKDERESKVGRLKTISPDLIDYLIGNIGSITMLVHDYTSTEKITRVKVYSKFDLKTSEVIKRLRRQMEEVRRKREAEEERSGSAQRRSRYQRYDPLSASIVEPPQVHSLSGVKGLHLGMNGHIMGVRMESNRPMEILQNLKRVSGKRGKLLFKMSISVRRSRNGGILQYLIYERARRRGNRWQSGKNPFLNLADDDIFLYVRSKRKGQIIDVRQEDVDFFIDRMNSVKVSLFDCNLGQCSREPYANFLLGDEHQPRRLLPFPMRKFSFTQ